jgi:hypothetical protein
MQERKNTANGTRAEYSSIIGDLTFSVCLPKKYSQNLGLDKGDLDEQPEKLKMYKSGYTKGFKVPKSEKPSESLGFEQEGYHTFGFKAFAAERMPVSTKAKGFRDRTIQMPCSFGFPEHDIQDAINNADDPIYKPLLAELDELRNRLLEYRIIHYHDPIPNIDTRLQAREKQLWNPLLRVFQNTQTYDTLRKVAIEFVNESRERKSHTHTAFMLNIIIELEHTQHKTTLDRMKQKYRINLGGTDISAYGHSSEQTGDNNSSKID